MKWILLKEFQQTWENGTEPSSGSNFVYLVNFTKTWWENVTGLCKTIKYWGFCAILTGTPFSRAVLKKGSPFTIHLGLVFIIYSKEKIR